MVLTMPIKLIDLILAKFPHAEKIASGFYIVARKKETQSIEHQESVS